MNTHYPKTLAIAVGVAGFVAFFSMFMSLARAGDADDRQYLAGLNMNEYRGCGFVHAASIGYLQQQAPEPAACAEAKEQFQGDWNRCYTFVLFTYNRRNGTSMPPDSIKGLGMIGCSMLMDNVPEPKAKKAAEQSLGAFDLSPALGGDARLRPPRRTDGGRLYPTSPAIPTPAMKAREH